MPANVINKTAGNTDFKGAAYKFYG